ncbi:YceI family protein [Mariniflexile sp.]|uniref:YceI family protein n=2 Tax=Mariniflexile sp. TaxID=1979402 RepID=UPI0040483F5B
MGKNLIFSIILLFSSNVSINAQNYVVNTGSASFKAKMPLNSYIGKSDDLQGTIDFKDGTMTFSVPVKSIKTDNEKRDGHMYELVKAEKNPNVVFDGKLIDDFNFEEKATQTLNVKGDFTLAGVTREITIPIELKLVSEGTIQLKASWSLLITDYNLERPSIMFIKVNDKHDLTVDALLEKK